MKIFWKGGVFSKKVLKMIVYNIDVSMILKSTETSHCYSKQSGPSQLFSELSFSSKSLRIKMVSNFSQNVLSKDINYHLDAQEFHKNTLKDFWDISAEIYASWAHWDFSYKSVIKVSNRVRRRLKYQILCNVSMILSHFFQEDYNVSNNWSRLLQEKDLKEKVASDKL